jgi:hypothetical protein
MGKNERSLQDVISGESDQQSGRSTATKQFQPNN